MPLLLLIVGAALAGLHRVSDAEHGKFSPLRSDVVRPYELLLALQMPFVNSRPPLSLDPRSCPGATGAGVKLCPHRRWFARPVHWICPYW